MHLLIVAMLCGCGSFICWLIGAIYFVLQKEVPPYMGLPEAAYMEAPRGQLSPYQHLSVFLSSTSKL